MIQPVSEPRESQGQDQGQDQSRPDGASIDPEEIEKFSAMAAAWWDPDGKFKPLHQLNPVRLAFLRDQACAHFGLTSDGANPLAGLSVLDVGCGGGLISEPLARLGAKVTAIDASHRNIEIARAHAQGSDLSIDYRAVAAEDLAEAGETFDLVISLEVVEHVADLDAFLATCAALVRPGGALALATINRTAKAYALAIVGAEYLLRWLPRGTHNWRKFVRPSELARGLRPAGLDITALTGLAYNPLSDRWRLDRRDLDVNYMAFAAKAPG